MAESSRTKGSSNEVEISPESLPSNLDREVKDLGIICGEAFYERNQPGDSLSAARDRAIAALRQKAQAIQANRVVDMRVDYMLGIPNNVAVTAHGNAVHVQDLPWYLVSF